MGGNPQASLENFELAFDASQRKFLLAQLLYAEFYCYRIQDPDEFESKLREVLEAPEDTLPEYRLLNLIAKRRAATLIEETDDLF